MADNLRKQVSDGRLIKDEVDLFFLSHIVESFAQSIKNTNSDQVLITFCLHYCDVL